MYAQKEGHEGFTSAASIWRLLDLYYLSESPIPLDTDAVARKIRSDLDVTESVLAEYFDRTDEGYRNPRCDIEISRYRHQV